MKKLRRLLVGLALVTPIIGLTQSAALAANAQVGRAVNSSAPCWTIESTSTEVVVYIGSNGHCTTSQTSEYLMGTVLVHRISTGKWSIVVTDTNCDSIGDYWKAHKSAGGQFNFGDNNGCSLGQNGYTVTKSELATTSVNWWVNWGGWNSLAYTFP